MTIDMTKKKSYARTGYISYSVLTYAHVHQMKIIKWWNCSRLNEALYVHKWKKERRKKEEKKRPYSFNSNTQAIEAKDENQNNA